jgi:GH35 family endo-1,4-beta-xylanase
VIGVHTRLTDEVEEVKIRRTMLMVREMGARWAVEFFPWAYIEPSRGTFDWRHSDLVVSAANEQGITLIARLDYVPAWARPKDTTPRYLDEERFADYARFAGEFARRYLGSVRYIAVWNEPNTSLEWGFRPVDPAAYTRLLAVAYAEIKAANPDAIVLPGGLAPTLEQGGQGLNDLVFLRRMYDAGAARWFDVMNVHAYGWTAPPDEPAAPDRLNYARVELVREVMVANGDAGKPVIITEAGWNDSPRWAKAVRPGQRIEYTVRAYEKARTEWPWVLAVNVWAFRLPAPARNYNDSFTLVDSEFSPRPIYDAIRAYAGTGR